MEIKDCSCGRDHETMPMIDISSCFCDFIEMPGCDHREELVEAVCREHKGHIPCRTCIRSGLDS